MMRLLRAYFRTPLVARILTAFALGTLLGLIVSAFPPESTARALAVVRPFGSILVSMLKTIVFPLVFFSLILGSSALPLKRFGRLGLSVVGWYFATSVFATVFGIALAMFLNPKMATFAEAAASRESEVAAREASGGGSLGDFFVGLFQNPFSALANGEFLPIVVFSIATGVAARVVLDSLRTTAEERRGVETFLTFCDGARALAFKAIDWATEYFPIGVFALTFVNFATDGANLFGPYLRIVGCVAAGTLGMVFVVYPAAIWAFCRENPYRVLARFRLPIATAFATRSSAATLAVSTSTTKEVGVASSLSSFSLPLGCTVNMDGVCVHLPVFVVLASNVFGVPFTASSLLTLLVSVVFASIGAGGVPGGSVFLLLMILENAGFTAEQTTAVVALALGINPLLDMFETACNVAGDLVCTYVVAKRNGLIGTENGENAD